jgi:cytochrome P450
MDSKVWSDAENRHTIDTFWPGRFLKYTHASSSVRFSLPATEGSWLPFGNGANICPGRHFAKIHCIVTLAMMVETFDCDILAELKISNWIRVSSEWAFLVLLARLLHVSSREDKWSKW